MPRRFGYAHSRRPAIPHEISAFLICAVLFALLAPDAADTAAGNESKAPEFVERMKEFPAQKSAAGIDGIGSRLSFRAKEQTFLLVATIIFVLTILHTFVAIPITNFAFMAWTVSFAPYPPIFIGGFLFFLAFSQATAHQQHPINLRGPILGGFFLTGLIIHGGIQGWWLGPIISTLSEWPLFIGATILTSSHGNAAMTFLASQVEGLGPQRKYAVLAGAVTGGGLTVIANTPPPHGQAVLSRFFGEGVSPAKLATGVITPTVIVALCMMFFTDKGIDQMFAPENEKGYVAPVAPATPTETP